MRSAPVLVSIVTVVRNDPDGVEDTIRSVIECGYDNIEHIVIDGASTDDTFERVRKFEPRFAYMVSEPDKGIYDAMNKGLARTSGDLVLMLNAGDQVVSGAIGRIVDAWNLHDEPDVIYGKKIVVDAKRKRYREQATDHRYLHKRPLDHQSTFVSGRVARKHRYNLRFKVCADWEHLSRIRNESGFFFRSDVVVSIFVADGISSDRLRSISRWILVPYRFGGLGAALAALFVALVKQTIKRSCLYDMACLRVYDMAIDETSCQDYPGLRRLARPRGAEPY